MGMIGHTLQVHLEVGKGKLVSTMHNQCLGFGLREWPLAVKKHLQISTYILALSIAAHRKIG